MKEVKYMPYIKKNERKKYEKAIEEITLQLNLQGTNGFYPVGDLNYIITTILTKTLDRQGIRYQTLNAIIGALECSKLELYRRMISPYEDTKVETNGDVY